MSNNRIFIFEFVSGGGFNQVDIPNSLFCEGYGMLKSIITDFKALNFEISTLLDNTSLCCVLPDLQKNNALLY